MGRGARGRRGVERLHLDHERPLHATCHRWRAAIPAAPRSLDDGLDGAALCPDNMFGVSAERDPDGAACVRDRCCPPRDAEGVVLRFLCGSCVARNTAIGSRLYLSWEGGGAQLTLGAAGGHCCQWCLCT